MPPQRPQPGAGGRRAGDRREVRSGPARVWGTRGGRALGEALAAPRAAAQVRAGPAGHRAVRKR